MSIISEINNERTRFNNELNHKAEHRRKFARQEIDRLYGEYEKGELIFDGNVIRWKLSHKVPPLDCLVKLEKVLAEHGKRLDIHSSYYVEREETQAFCEAYREKMKNHKPSHEELCEMQNAFGKGTKVVDVISGQVYQL